MMEEIMKKIEKVAEGMSVSLIVKSDVNARVIYALGYQERAGLNFLVAAISGGNGLADWEKIVFYGTFAEAFEDWSKRTKNGFDKEYWVDENESAFIEFGK